MGRFYDTSVWDEAREARLVEQDHKCAICADDLTTINSKLVHLDHNHKTDQIRGVLCKHCNVGIGNFKEDGALMLKAIRYLTYWNKQPSDNTQLLDKVIAA